MFGLLQRPQPAMDALSDCDSVLGSSPISPLPVPCWAQPPAGPPGCKQAAVLVPVPQEQLATSYTHLSYRTLVGISELLGHSLEDRTGIASQQDPQLASQLHHSSSTQLRSSTQQPLFTVAPLDVLVTRDAATGQNTFHIIEINGTGIAGLSNMPDDVVGQILQSMSELPQQLAHVSNPMVLVASSGQESHPPVSRTMHEKVLYIEALRRGFEALGRTVTVTNMNRIEKDAKPLASEGVVLVLGYMKQFRRHMSLGTQGQMMLCGRQVHAAINDRFILNCMYQLDFKVDMAQFTAHNSAFTAGADKGVAYTLYNAFFSDQGEGAARQHTCMAPRINFTRATTREQLVQQVLQWLDAQHRPVVIKPQGTGCGHGIEFFFGSPAQEEVEAKVDASLASVSSNYELACGGLPFTTCEYLDTAAISTGHKFELRIVVYREGEVLRAYPSIAKVAREAFDPENPDKSSLINNITTSAKETSQSGSEFMLPLCSPRTLELLGIQGSELAQLCKACTAFIRYTLDQLQDNPDVFGLPANSNKPSVSSKPAASV